MNRKFCVFFQQFETLYKAIAACLLIYPTLLKPKKLTNLPKDNWRQLTAFCQCHLKRFQNVYYSSQMQEGKKIEKDSMEKFTF